MIRLISHLLICLTSAFLLISCASSLSGVHQYSIEDDSMVVIPEGWFTMGLDTGEPGERPAHEVLVDTFRIDRYEVSAEKFAEFLNERGNPENKYFTQDKWSAVAEVSQIAGEETKTSAPRQEYVPRKGFEKYPANNVSWYGAYEYCRWKGKRLPTEAEWEKAARSDDKRNYPWGNSMPDDTKAVYARDWKEKGMNVMVPVDALPEGASYYGVLNMAGNVGEWVNDWYRQNYCDYCDPTSKDYISTVAEIIGTDKAAVEGDKKNVDIPPKNNPQGPPIGAFKVLRGGSWIAESELEVRSTYRNWLAPAERNMDTGFRCAESAPE